MRQGEVDPAAQIAMGDLSVDRVHARGKNLDQDIVRPRLRDRHLREAQRGEAVIAGEVRAFMVCLLV